MFLWLLLKLFGMIKNDAILWRRSQLDHTMHAVRNIWTVCLRALAVRVDMVEPLTSAKAISNHIINYTYMHTYVCVWSNKWKFQVAIACGDVARRRGRCERDRSHVDCCCAVYFERIEKSNASKESKQVDRNVCVYTQLCERAFSELFVDELVYIFYLYN